MQDIQIVDYIYKVVDDLKKQGINITDKVVDELIEQYSDSDMPVEVAMANIDSVAEEYMMKTEKRKEKFSQLTAQVPYMKSLQNLPIKYNGITLNNQDIDLMMIACSDSPEELKSVLDKITNIRVSLGSTDMSDEDFRKIRADAYRMYIGALASRNDWIRQPNLLLSRKITYLKESGLLDDEEVSKLEDILKSTRGIKNLIYALESTFPGKFHNMFEVIRDFDAVEKEGISLMTVEKSRRLAEQIRNNYNSITIDDEAKYGKVVLQDGTFNFKHLSKALDFARSIGKEVRLNTLLFYMDCPSELYELEVSEENRRLVKDKLLKYVDATTKYVADNYSDVVRSIDVFNELLCRHSLISDDSVVDWDR